MHGERNYEQNADAQSRRTLADVLVDVEAGGPCGVPQLVQSCGDVPLRHNARFHDVPDAAVVRDEGPDFGRVVVAQHRLDRDRYFRRGVVAALRRLPTHEASHQETRPRCSAALEEHAGRQGGGRKGRGTSETTTARSVVRMWADTEGHV